MGSGSSRAPSRASRRSSSVDASKVDVSAKEPRKSVAASKSSEAKDVMISYSHADKDIMLQLKEGLERNGFSVWVDVTGLRAGVDFLSKIGEAIIDAKMIISLLSLKTVESRYCQDELALAYVSNKPIFPVGIQAPSDLFPMMDTGMKLQLARFEWSLFLDNAKFDENLSKLVERMRAQMTEEVETVPVGPGHTAPRRLNRQTSTVNGKAMVDSGLESAMSTELDETTKMSFWERNFSESEEKINWEDFRMAFHNEYQSALDSMFDQSDQVWVDSIMHRELHVDDHDGHVTKEAYVDMCTTDDVFRPFWDRMQDKCVESYAMKEVFNMESSVRVQAIENLGKFKSDFVVESLLDLLSDNDKNVRVVAAISLAKTATNRSDVANRLIVCLKDNDRLVRESACLALGRLRVESAVQKIIHLWRNDVISSVREAAQIALEQIGGDEANKAMHMTKVLAEEIRTLTE